MCLNLFGGWTVLHYIPYFGIMELFEDFFLVSHAKVFEASSQFSLPSTWQSSCCLSRSRVLSPQLVCWSPQPSGSYKLNVNGSCFRNLGCWWKEYRSVCSRSGFGGVHFGFWTYDEQVLTLEAGLRLCLDKGWSDVLVETDSMVLYQMVRGDISLPWKLYSFIPKIRCLMAADQFQISHIFREANMVADSLAKMVALLWVLISVLNLLFHNQYVACLPGLHANSFY
ncbi:hypothetical protein ACH5RR_026427 [Cinchona calisaya]|uniref:RNase H type-1 domain-containing protein n=1 Tax=Cinchona calisaya TaxID=153742 RepID=A0ABD2Z2K2_9GENT